MRPARRPPHPREYVLREMKTRLLEKLERELEEKPESLLIMEWHLPLGYTQLRSFFNDQPMTLELAKALEQAWGVSKDSWMEMQKNHDEWEEL